MGRICLISFVLIACGPTGTSSNHCGNICSFYEAKCGVDESCASECSDKVSGKTSASKKAVTECVEKAAGCLESSDCYSLLEDAPPPSMTTGTSGTGGITGSFTGGGSGASTGGTGASSLAAAFCQKGVDCDLIPPNKEDDCLVGMTVQMTIFGDLISSNASSCVTNASCQDFDENTDPLLTECTGVDPNSFVCTGEAMLKACNLKGNCINIDCQKVCDQFAPGSEAECEPKGDGGSNCGCVTSIEIESVDEDESSSGSPEPEPTPPEG
jgi:hypothetical protein